MVQVGSGMSVDPYLNFIDLGAHALCRSHVWFASRHKEACVPSGLMVLINASVVVCAGE
jgi:hypothetical protein